LTRYVCKPLVQDGKVTGYQVGPVIEGHGAPKGMEILYGADYWRHRKAVQDQAGEWIVVEDLEAKVKESKEIENTESVREIFAALDSETLKQIVKLVKSGKASR